ncbi:MAG: helix-turn-helix domain-containing protein [Polyangiaceae bacterium]|nr:helix-turn-helix domain-containing protein [Polyangiaceae bacterium]
MRSRIVLLAADGLTNKQIGPKVGACAHTVGTWRSRFIRSGTSTRCGNPCDTNASPKVPQAP